MLTQQTRSLANLAVTPEQRKANLVKGAVTRRKNRDEKWREIYLSYVRQGLDKTTFERAAGVLGISSHTIRRIVRWAQEQNKK